jgi:chaperonin cofactor prefoldin
MLGELKRMAKLNEELTLEKENTENEIQKLKNQIKDWQIKHEKIKIELRTMKGKLSSLSFISYLINIK